MALLHLRLTLRSRGALCGALPTELSQSVLGMQVQEILYAQTLVFPIPAESDYCETCWAELHRSAPAIEALLHLPSPINTSSRT